MSPSKIILVISALVLFFSGFLVGSAWHDFYYTDICLDMGGGRNPGGHAICILPSEAPRITE